MFAFVIVLSLASAAMELTFASKFPVWRKAAKRNKAINLVISVAISFIIGIMFGAAGLITMAAAIISTVIVIPGYAFLEWAYDSPQAATRGGNQIKYYSDKTKEVVSDTFKIIYKILRVITFPIWGSRIARDKYRNFKLRTPQN
jgi:hypothetical protein